MKALRTTVAALIFATFPLVSSAAISSKIKCEATLPPNNSYGLPVNWTIELDTYEDFASVTYSGKTLKAGAVIGDVLATEEYSGGWDIGDFGYKVNDRELRILLAFKEEGYRRGEMRFRAKMDRFKKGVKLLDVATATCNPVN